MKKRRRLAIIGLEFGLSVTLLALTACGGGGNAVVTPIVNTYVLTVNTANPASGVSITVSPADKSGAGNGSSSFTRTYNAGTAVTLTAPATAGTAKFSSWSGCTTTSTVTCTVTVNANTTVTATYISSPITSVTVTPNPATAVIGATVQFAAVVVGTGTFDNTVTWSLLGPPGSTLSAGTITSTGLYTTPYPAPATVTVVATSNQDSTQSGSVTVTLNSPATSVSPGIAVEVSNQTHPINPYIYGMNAYQLDPNEAKAVRLSLDRWGGDAATSYNYLLDTDNSASDYYFENFPGSATNYPQNSEFNTQVVADAANGTKTLGTVPLTGWTPLRNNACSYSVAKYGAQKATDPYKPDCGNGILLSGAQIVNDPTDTYSHIDQTFTAGWVNFLAGKFGTAASGGVAIYDLDNEPEWWDGVHSDIHPKPFTYDELTTKGLAYAKAIKDNDPTAEVSGPVISFWMDFFYSKKDIETGWGTGPCYCANGNPTDRMAHSNIPFIEYYLQQFKAYDDANHVRLLDYVDLHTYFAANNGGFSTAGDTSAQAARLNSTRVFWDPTYTDPNYTDPDNRTSSAQPVPPNLIHRMQAWVAADYPGTKTAITEYNWGGQEHINGALAQADILGIFGSYGLDLGTLWGPPNPVTQVPGLMAFEIFRNYDGSGSQFGDISLAASSLDQGKLAVYAALRSSDNAVTVVVLNKTYGDFTGPLNLASLVPNGNAKAYLYSNANLAAIVAQPDLPVTRPTGSSNISTITTTFPAQSITLFVIPQK